MQSINRKIVGYSVVTPDKAQEDAAPPAPVLEELPRRRPEELHGTTYKIKSPMMENAIYVTINDVVLNAGTEHEQVRPLEIFINSKSTENAQWIAALTLTISAIFRQGGRVDLIAEELRNVHDHSGGYYRNGVFIPSLAAEIGLVLQKHLAKAAGEGDAPDAEALALAAQKREALVTPVSSPQSLEDAAEPAVPGAVACPKCKAVQMIKMDGCDTCLACGHSKCG